MNIKLVTLFFTILISFSMSAQQFNKADKAVAGDRGTLDYFGHSVSISGEFFIVGAFNEDHNEVGIAPMEKSGSAYIFNQDINGSWLQTQKLVASDRSVDDRFGWAVALDNDWAVVGAYLEDHDENGHYYQQDAGSVYLFKKNISGIWTETQKLTASDRQSNDYFGAAVDISGNYIAVGALQEDHDQNGNNAKSQAGSVYIFKKDAQDNWNEIGKVLPNDRGIGDEFGNSVSLSNNRLLVGAHYEDHNLIGSQNRSNAGSAYVFVRDVNDNFTQEAKLIASDRAPYDEFGFAVDIYDNKIVVGAFEEDEDINGSNSQSGAGSAYIFKLNSQNNWIQQQKIIGNDRSPDDRFGYSVAIEKNHCLIGVYQEDYDAYGNILKGDAGAAFIFEENAIGQWTLLEKIVAFDRDTFDNFGWAVDINGSNVLIGANKEDEDLNSGNRLTNSGSVYIFEYSSFVGINDNLPPLSFNIFPTPFNDVLLISADNDNINDKLNIKLFNLLGEEVFNKNFSAASELKLDLQYLLAGVYILQLNNGSKISNTRIIKTNY